MNMKKFDIYKNVQLIPGLYPDQTVELKLSSVDTKKFSLNVVSLKEDSIKLQEHYSNTQVFYILNGYGALYLGECSLKKGGTCEKTSDLIFLERGMLVVIPPHTLYSVDAVKKDEKKALEFLIFAVPANENDFREICNNCK